MEKLINKLKELIDQNGPNYLTQEPYEAYKQIVKSKVTEKRIADAVLMLLVSGVLSNVKKSDLESLSILIQDECSFTKEMADYLAELSLSLFSVQNQKEWKKNRLVGLEQFKNEELKLKWEGFAVWRCRSGEVRCNYDGIIVISPTENLVVDSGLKKILDKNPFTTKEDIGDWYREKLTKYLDREFEEYVTSDDYYEPVIEDYEFSYDVEHWCKENGFEMVSCEGDGEASDFISDWRW